MTPSVKTSVRVPRDLLAQLERLRGDRRLTDVINEALATWVEEQQRLQWGRQISESLRERSPERRQESRQTAGLASQAALRAMEKRHGSPSEAG